MSIRSKSVKKYNARDAVKNIIIKRMMRKYKKVPGAFNVITERVDKLMNQLHVTAGNLYKLEYEIEQMLIFKREPIKKASKEPINEYNNVLELPEIVKSKCNLNNDNSINIQKNVEAQNSRDQTIEYFMEECYKADKKVTPYNEFKSWDDVTKIDRMLYEEEKKQEKLDRIKRMHTLRALLDKQVQEKKQSRSLENNGVQSTHLERVMKEDRERMIRRGKLSRINKTVLEEQIKTEAERKLKEYISNKKDDKQILEKLENDARMELSAQKQMKTIRRKMDLKMMEENKNNKLKQLEDNKIMEEREKERLEKEERERDEKEVKRQERKKRNQMKSFELMKIMAGTITLNANHKKIEEDKRIARHKEYEDRHYTLKAKNMDRTRLKLKEEMIDKLNEQIREKKEREELNRYENELQAEIWKKDLIEYNNKQKSMKKNIEILNRTCANYLKQQILGNNKSTKNPMTKEEYLMNKKIFDIAKQKGIA